MNSLDALRRMVASYPGGRSALAARMGKSDEVLRKELSGTSAHHKMGLADAEEIAAMCHEVGSPDPLGNEFGKRDLKCKGARAFRQMLKGWRHPFYMDGEQVNPKEAL